MQPAESNHAKKLDPAVVVVIAVAGLGLLGLVGFQIWRFATGRVGEPHARTEPVEPLYPRMTCEQGKAELDEAVRSGTAGRPIVLRPTELVIHARVPGANDHEIECDGIRLPVVDARQGDPNGPFRYAPGPHAVFVRAEPSGKLTVFSYCGRCNVVGEERRQRQVF